MNRRDFIIQTSHLFYAAVAATGALALGACGGSDNEPGGGGSDAAGCGQSTIAGNHGHELAVDQADIDAGVERTYDITGGSAHAHSVTLSADDFAALQAGEEVTVVSTDGGGHTHSVTVVCA